MSAVACLPSGLVHQPPAWTRNAPTRSRVPSIASGVTPAALILPAVAVSCSQVAGMSASVSPAYAQRSVLICSARVEVSLGTQ